MRINRYHLSKYFVETILKKFEISTLLFIQFELVSDEQTS